MARIEVFHFSINRTREIFSYFIEFDHGRIANGLKDIVVNGAHGPICFVLGPVKITDCAPGTRVLKRNECSG